MSIRIPASFALAVLITFGLFWTMQALIGVTGELKEGRNAGSIEFVRLKRDSRPVEKKREPPKRAKPDHPPPPPEMNLAKNINPSEAVGTIIPMADAAVELGKATSLGAGGGDSDIVPLVRVEPQYPPKARQRRIQGWVELVFSISPAGTVENPKVLAAYPPSVFEQAALRAVRRWRYNPKVVDGAAVTRHGVKVRMRFELSGA